jgi:VCBS repeat-containing protein
LNDDGTAVATVGLLDPNVPQGFRDVIVWQNGVPSFLPPVPENLLAGCSEVRGRRPFGINRAGHIFGKSGGFELPGGNSCDRYWIYKNGAFEMLPLRDPDGSPGVCELTYAPYEGASGDRLNDSDHVVVQRTRIAFNASSNCLPFPEFAGILAGTSFTPIAEAFAFQINNHDQLLLFTLDPNGRARSHLWNGSMLVDLGIDAGGYSLNNLGQLTFKIIVGAECPLRMYSNGTVTDVPLPSDLSYLNLACHSTFLNDAGQIVLSPSGGPERAVLLTPTGGPNLDVTAPVLTNIPSNQTLVATSSAGAIVSWSPLTADDDRDGPVPVVCSPSSGSVFPIGVMTVTCTASDEAGNLGSASFTVMVLSTPPPPDNPPVAQNGTITTDEDTPFNGTLIASDADGDALTFSLVTSPARGSLVITNPSTGAFTYTPAPNRFGGDSFTFQVNANDGISNIATVTIDITPVNDAPVAFDGSLSTEEDAPATGSFLASDPDSLLVQFEVASQPAHGTVTIPNPVASPLGGSFTYIPHANYNGPDSFTFRTVDAGLNSNVATITITVTPVNDAPDTSAVVLTMQEGVARSGVLRATDVDDVALTFAIETPPTRGIVMITDTTTGAFTYTPNAGMLGYDAFTFRATDAAGASSTASGMAFIVTASPSWPGQTVRVDDVASRGLPGIASGRTALSADGRYVAFSSSASNLVPGDTNGVADVFVHDRATGATTRVSVAGDGTQGDDLSYDPVLSADGRYVAFGSRATTLVAGDTNHADDVFVHDRQTGEIRRVSIASDGTQNMTNSTVNALSADGRYVAFISDPLYLVPGSLGGWSDVFVHDLQTGLTTRESVASDGTPGNSTSYLAVLSGDGRYVAFVSLASNLVAGDTNQASDAFVHDRQTGQTSRVSVASNGAQSNAHSFSAALSADGRYVAFWSSAANLVAGDTGSYEDVFVHDRQTGQTSRVSVASDGGETNGYSSHPELSADGRYVAFVSTASNLVAGDTDQVNDVFIYDRLTAQTVLLSVASDGSSWTNHIDNNMPVALSGDGRFVAFTSGTIMTSEVFVVGGVSVSPTVFDIPGGGGTRSVSVSFDYPGTPWTATTTTSWITINPPIGGSANDTVNFTVAPNAGPARTGTLVVALQTVTVTQDASAPPVAQNDAITTAEDGSAAGTLRAIDPNGDAITFSLLAPPAHGTAVLTNSSTGAFTYTPPANYNGPDSFTFNATAGGETSNTATVAVTVTPVNDPPIAQNGSNSVFTGASVSGTLVATDIDSPSLTYVIVANGTKGTAVVTNATTGAYIYTANAGASGTDSFTFRANDGSLNSADATVTVTITTNRPPTVNNGSLTTQEDKSGSGTLSATDLDGNRLTFTIVSNGSKGTATITNASMGRFSYVPKPDANGSDTFTFKTNDGLADSNVATVTITITAVNDAPVAKDANYTITRNTAVTATAVGTDVDGDQLTYSISKAPRRGTITNFNSATGGFTYTPLTTFVGTDSFTFKVSDGKASATATISVTVN